MTNFYISNGSSFTQVPVAMVGATENNGVVRATSNTWEDDIPENKVMNMQSFIGTYTEGYGNWYTIISCRHRNNVADGPAYGMYIKTPLVSFGNLIWNNEVDSKWGTARTIYDSGNPEMVVSSSQPTNEGCKIWIQP